MPKFVRTVRIKFKWLTDVSTYRNDPRDADNLAAVNRQIYVCQVAAKRFG